MLLSAIAALLLAAALLFLIHKLRASALLPVRPRDSQTLTVTLRASGDDPYLENTVNALLWLRENGTLPASIVIEDGGMSASALLTARLLEKKHACIRLNTNVEDSTWESRNI